MIHRSHQIKSNFYGKEPNHNKGDLLTLTCRVGLDHSLLNTPKMNTMIVRLKMAFFLYRYKWFVPIKWMKSGVLQPAQWLNKESGNLIGNGIVLLNEMMKDFQWRFNILAANIKSLWALVYIYDINLTYYITPKLTYFRNTLFNI